MATTTPRGQRGITLIEIVLWCAIVAAAVVAVFVFGKKASVTAAVETEQRQVEDIVKTVDSIFATQPNFAALGTNGAAYLRERAARSGLKFETNDAGDPVLTTGLGGGSLTLSAWDALPPSGPAVPNSGYRLAYQGLDGSECSKLVTATYPVAYQVSAGSAGLNDSSATNLATRGQMTVSPAVIAENCAAGDGNATVFLYFYPARAIAGATTATPPPAARCNPAHETQNVACPAGQVGTITQERDGTCTGPGNTMVYTAWATTNNTCQVPPPGQVVVTPPTIPDNCAPFTFTRVRACPLGQLGQIVETRDVDSCAGTTTPWTVDPSATTCQTTPAATCTPGMQTQVIACPAGQAGNIIQVRSSSCASPTAVPTWSPYTQSSNTCSSNAGCIAAGTCCTPQREQRDNNAACPAGTYGDLAQKQERFQGCINATTASPSWSAWQAFASTGSCTACPATSTETTSRWSPRNAACPAGEVGVNEWEAEEISTRDMSYSCPAGSTVLPAPTYTAWSSYSETGAVRNVVNTCAPATCTGPASETQWAGTIGTCAVGETGSNTWEREQSRSRTCNAGVWSSWSPWTDTGATRNPVNTCVPTTCTGSSSATQWLPTVGACPVGETGTNTWEREQQRTRTCTAGSWDPWGGWTDTGATRNPVYTCAPATCTGSPTNTQWLPASAVCPVGETGSNTWEYEQSQTRVCTAGVWGAWGSWTSTGATRNVVNTCAPVAACYKPSAITYTQSGPADGPANFFSEFVINGNEGQTNCEDRGTNLDCMGVMQGYTGPWDGYFNGTYNLSSQGLSIDANGLVLPVSGTCSPGDFGTFSTTPKPSGTGWRMIDTWGWTCEARPAAECAPSPPTCTGPSSETQWLSGSAACPVGETGTNTWEYEQTRSRTCTSGTWDAWGGWSNTGATRNVVNTCAPVATGHWQMDSSGGGPEVACAAPDRYIETWTWPGGSGYCENRNMPYDRIECYDGAASRSNEMISTAGLEIGRYAFFTPGGSCIPGQVAAWSVCNGGSSGDAYMWGESWICVP